MINSSPFRHRTQPVGYATVDKRISVCCPVRAAVPKSMASRQKCVKAAFQLLQARGLSSSSSSSSSPSSCSSNSTKTAFQEWLHACHQPNTTASTGWGLMRAAKQQFRQCRAFSAEAVGGPTKQPAAARSAAGPRAAPQATAAGGGGTAGAAPGGAAPAPQLSPFEKWWRNFQRVPPAPKWLGLAGAIPFIALAPPVCKHLAPLLPSTISENCDMVQMCYGVVVVTFLGAVHWGVAMAMPLTSPIAYRLANEAFVWSVIPSMMAWPVALMDPAWGSCLLCLLLPFCYAADYTRRNVGLPAWYLTLRAPLTLMATFGMLLTATRHIYTELDKARALEQQQAAGAGQA